MKYYAGKIIAKVISSNSPDKHVDGHWEIRRVNMFLWKAHVTWRISPMCGGGKITKNYKARTLQSIRKMVNNGCMEAASDPEALLIEMDKCTCANAPRFGSPSGGRDIIPWSCAVHGFMKYKREEIQ